MRYPRHSLLVIAVCLVIAGCHKGGYPTPSSSLLFVNASVHESSINIYTDGTLFVSNLNFPDSTGYLSTREPVRALSILSAGDTVFSQPANFTTGREYSIFVADTGVNTGVQVTAVPDSFPATRPGYAFLRFLNFTPSVSNLDLYSTTLSQDLFTDRYFEENDAFSTTFVPYPSGTYELELRAPGTFVTVASLAAVTFEDGKAYTIFAKGATGVAGNRTLGIAILQHD
ncbi:DUF4397 domain-containing protein [Dinghuibacter silviterrae]|uniref:Uncharacterized protein DUF4397 n=1 Tax=Dinghuibacter silviterrae TaxID=1539049 RepID=A0A4R8DK18_9BACT|nr:DUF4397 domain-containing protein [Dinghuibacter silviterrae]TDW97526.1 uncharacterized protein DUF4397 [Dinghuibacter silviterrae]